MLFGSLGGWSATVVKTRIVANGIDAVTDHRDGSTGQVLICSGCCCGAVDRGRPEVPVEWIKKEWRRRGLLKRLQLTISGCLGPCDVPNVVAIVSDVTTLWYGNVSGQWMYEEVVDWASASVAAGRLLDVPKSLANHSIDPFRRNAL